MVSGILWDLIQQRQIRDATKDAADAKDVARLSKGDIRNLQARVDGLALLCEAMWELIRDSNHFTEQSLVEKIEEIDLRDGNADGRASKGKVCSECQRIVNTRRPLCPYCGTKFPQLSGFDTA